MVGINKLANIYDKINPESLSTNLEIKATDCVYFSKRPVIRN